MPRFIFSFHSACVCSLCFFFNIKKYISQVTDNSPNISNFVNFTDFSTYCYRISFVYNCVCGTVRRDETKWNILFSLVCLVNLFKFPTLFFSSSRFNEKKERARQKKMACLKWKIDSFHLCPWMGGCQE